MIIFQSPDTGLRSAPVDDADVARRQYLEAQGWTPVDSASEAEDRRRILEVVAEVKQRSGPRVDLPALHAALGAAGLAAAWYRLPASERAGFTEESK